MSVPALSLPPILIDSRRRVASNSGRLEAELLERASRDGYAEWLPVALVAGLDPLPRHLSPRRG